MDDRRFLLASIQPRGVSDTQAFGPLRELWSLVESLGGTVVDVEIQKREVHDKGMYLGAGKMADISQRLKPDDIDVVVLNDIVKPGHLYEMKTAWQKHKPDIDVWDRVDLILQIFSQHAHTAEAKLQIELAQMRHMGPRIYGMGVEMSRQGGGIGGRGIGETNTERMKRHWSAQMKKAEEKLAKMSGDRERQMQRRARAGLRTVSIVGYTNAGKTTLYNALVGKQKFAHDMLFATLDASVGKLYLPDAQQEVLLSDTIGFIQGLPPELIEAFKSTLMESLHADLLLQVIDASDDYMPDKLRVVDKILSDLGLAHTPRLYVFTKMDAVDRVTADQLLQRYKQHDPQCVSVIDGQGLDQLVAQIAQAMATVAV